MQRVPPANSILEKEAKDHVGHVCERLLALHRSRPIDRLVVGGPAEIVVVESEALDSLGNVAALLRY